MFGVIRGERLPPWAAGLVVFADPTAMCAGASDIGGAAGNRTDVIVRRYTEM
jgi:hypothetical protein